MSDAAHEYRERGFTVFGHDPDIERWARACAPLAEEAWRDPAHEQWLRCAGTWFAGVNALPNEADGSVAGRSVPPLSGEAVRFVRGDLGHGEFAWDAAQISIVWPGYPKQGAEESEAAWRYRVKRCAAHVDGLERSPDRRRKLSETHGFVLGVPLGDSGAEEGAFVVWEGSHKIMRAVFTRAFRDVAPENWRDVDLTDFYVGARTRCFEVCKRIEIAPGLGHSYVTHPLALHGVAPWRAGDGPPRAVAYFRPDTFGGDPQKWLAA